MRTTSYILLILLTLACTQQTNYYSLPTFSQNGRLNAIIEIPAGTNHKVEYQPDKNIFAIDQENGKDRVIQYLPYPGNYGFIPGTQSDTSTGGDGDALDILVLAPAISSKTIMEVQPIAILKLIDDGEKDYKIVAIPTKNHFQTIKATSLEELQSQYPKALEIVETWFLYYNTSDPTKSLGWGDEEEALQEIKKHVKR